MIIMGAGINHWFNSDTIYRSILNLVMLCGCQGVNGGGWAYYVGQEKCRPIEGWSTIAFAKDWQGPPRLQNATSWFYFATDQWKYEESGVDKLQSPLSNELKHQHPADYNVLAARLGWLPSYPQFDCNSLLFGEEAKEAGVVNGIVSMMGGLGGFFPPLIITFVTSLTGSNHLAFFLLALFGIIALITMMHMTKLEKKIL